jgi:hypothetical protein
MLSILCQLTADDYVKAQYLHLRPSPWVKYLVLGLVGLGLAVLVSGALSPFLLTNLLIAALPILFFGVIYGFILLVIVPSKTRRVFAQQKSLQAQYEIVISPDTIETTSEQGTSRMAITDFYKYKVGQDLVLLYQSQALFHMFPRRVFDSESDFKQFLRYLEANLGHPRN